MKKYYATVEVFGRIGDDADIHDITVEAETPKEAIVKAGNSAVGYPEWELKDIVTGGVAEDATDTAIVITDSWSVFMCETAYIYVASTKENVDKAIATIDKWDGIVPFTDQTKRK